MTKAEQVKQYNAEHNYQITNIKKMTAEQISWYVKYGSKSLSEHYNKPSYAKQDSYNWILRTYKPKQILAVQGNSMTYSVLLVADNGDTLHITKANNYLVQVTA